MSEIWFTADTHFGHKNIIKYCNRPYEDVDEMNKAIVKNFNELIAPDDVLFHLGDIAMSAKGAAPISQVNGHKRLIAGNHESCWPNFSPTQLQKYFAYGFDNIDVSGTITLEGESVKMSHFPYQKDERHGERYSEYRPEDTGEWLIHGHVHDLWKVNGRQINVGVDVWDMKPVHVSEIVSIMTSDL